jgi:hypothetical protein
MILTLLLSLDTDSTAVFSKKYLAVHKHSKIFLAQPVSLGATKVCRYTHLFASKTPSLRLLHFMQLLQSAITSTKAVFHCLFHFPTLHDQELQCVIHAEKWRK